jgi:hypothetical protein
MVDRISFIFQRLKLQYDEPVSIFAFSFNLRRYTEALLQLQEMYLDTKKGLVVGPAAYFSPRHPAHSKPSFGKFHGII